MEDRGALGKIVHMDKDDSLVKVAPLDGILCTTKTSHLPNEEAIAIADLDCDQPAFCFYFSRMFSLP